MTTVPDGFIANEYILSLLPFNDDAENDFLINLRYFLIDIIFEIFFMSITFHRHFYNIWFNIIYFNQILTNASNIIKARNILKND